MARPNQAGNKHSYEVCAIFDAGLTDKSATTLLDKYLDVIKNDGGTIDKIDVWGRRTLAYEIKKQKEGFYIIVNFTSTASTKDEFDRRLGLEESTLRYKVFRVGE